MTVQLIAVLLGALALLLVREIHLYHNLKNRSDAQLEEDRQVADLEAIWDLDWWEWPA